MSIRTIKALQKIAANLAPRTNSRYDAASRALVAADPPTSDEISDYQDEQERQAKIAERERLLTSGNKYLENFKSFWSRPYFGVFSSWSDAADQRDRSIVSAARAEEAYKKKLAEHNEQLRRRQAYDQWERDRDYDHYLYKNKIYDKRYVSEPENFDPVNTRHSSLGIVDEHGRVPESTVINDRRVYRAPAEDPNAGYDYYVLTPKPYYTNKEKWPGSIMPEQEFHAWNKKRKEIEAKESQKRLAEYRAWKKAFDERRARRATAEAAPKTPAPPSSAPRTTPPTANSSQGISIR